MRYSRKGIRMGKSDGKTRKKTQRDAEEPGGKEGH
jgi:hypothetical protein